MQSLNSLYFPETVLSHHLRSCLLLLPDTLHLLQAVENSGGSSGSPEGSDLFMEQAICQVHTPAPLGKDRDRFLKLLDEIKTRKDCFTEQLSSLTLAHLSSTQGRGDHSSQAINSAILDGTVPGDTESTKESQKAALWQARLVLALAETLDQEEAELAERLSDIGDTELALFQELRGDGNEKAEEEDPFAELMHIKANINQPRPGTVKRRLQAWKNLYVAGTLPEEFWFWITTQEEAAELLIDSYETRAGRNSVPLLRLNIPAQMYMRDSDAVEAIRHFQKETDTLRKDITGKLAAIVALDHLNIVDPVALLPDAGILARDWNEQVEYFFPTHRYGCQTLDIQFLANISLDMLLRRQDSGEQPSAIRHGIVAIIKESQPQ